jgi:F0F1-type ATP synthase assembly protein I
VAELLARNGTIGAPAITRRRRRRRGDSDAVTVAELTGEIPVVRDDDHDETKPEANGAVQVAEPAAQVRAEPISEIATSEQVREDQPETAYWSEPEPRWPKSPPQPQRVSGPERSAYPRPLRQADAGDADRTGQPGQQSGAEGMRPDPVGDYADIPVDVMDSEVRAAEPATEDSAYVRSFLEASDSALFGGQTLADEVARRRGGERAGLAGEEELDEDHLDIKADRAEEAQDVRGAHGRIEALWRGSLIVLQSILAVAFGAGLFVAFDQLWRWNSLVALVLSVLVILGLVAGVRVVRKTEDVASTLIAVAVGALITLGPLALSLQSG